jgi:hypothetical protein
LDSHSHFQSLIQQCLHAERLSCGDRLAETHCPPLRAKIGCEQKSQVLWQCGYLDRIHVGFSSMGIYWFGAWSYGCAGNLDSAASSMAGGVGRSVL